MSADDIRVKILTREHNHILARQLPPDHRWGRCRFLFDDDARDYDWLLVYEDLPALPSGERLRIEPLACAPEHTLLVTIEPSSVKAYGRAYTDQFSFVLTSQEPWALPHPRRIHRQAGLRWFYGQGSERLLDWQTLRDLPPPDKTRDLSMVWSGKREWHTCHRHRFEFMRRLREALPDLDVYGRGVRPLDDKAEALDAYRYHIAIENHIAPHHWTEKLADPFLGLSLPFYFGCPNLEDYFPPESFIRIDVHDFEGSLRTIREAIASDEYTRRLPALREARRLVLEEYNLFAEAARIIEANFDPARPRGGRLCSRHAIRRERPLSALFHIWEKLYNPLRYQLTTRCRLRR